MAVSRAETARKRAQLLDLAAAGTSTAQIARELHMDRRDVRRLRNEAGHPAPEKIRQPLTLEEKWRANTRPVDGGHLEWLGECQRTSGTPVMRYRERCYTAAAIAFEIQHGRKPVGQAFAECGFKHCVAPEHVDDTETRVRDRQALRMVLGMRPAKEKCRRGHDQAAHGRRLPSGVAYCERCRREHRGPRLADA